MAELWGGETRKAVENFPVSGEPIPARSCTGWAGSRPPRRAVNAELGLLDAGQGRADRRRRRPDRGRRARRPVPDRRLPDRLGHLLQHERQRGDRNSRRRGHRTPTTTSTWASRPTTCSRRPCTWPRSTAPSTSCCPRWTAGGLARGQGGEFADVVKSGRTHLMDAVPVTLGQEFGGYAAQVREGTRRVGNSLTGLGQIPLGGTAVGNGLNTHPEFAARVRKRLAADSGLEILPPADPFEAQANRDGLVEASGALKSVAVSLTKIANDLRWMGSGPRAGIAEIVIPELQKGSSIMPGKVNPVIPEVVCQVSAQVIGNDTAITVGGLQGNFELNVQIPLIARNLLQSIGLLTSASPAVRRRAASTASRPTWPAPSARARRRSRSRRRSTRTSATTGRRRSSRTPPPRAAAARGRARARRGGLGARRGARPAQDRGRKPGDLMDVLVLQHIACEPPGEFEDVLVERGARIHRVELDEGEPLPEGAVVRRDRRDGRPDVGQRRGRASVAGRREAADPRRGRGWHAVLGRVPGRPAARLEPGRARLRRRRLPEVGVLAVELTDEGRADPVLRAGCRRRSPRFSGTATRSTCPPARSGWPSRRPIPTRRSATGRGAYGVQFHVEVSGRWPAEWGHDPRVRASTPERTLGDGGIDRLLADFSPTATRCSGTRARCSRPGLSHAVAVTR